MFLSVLDDLAMCKYWNGQPASRCRSMETQACALCHKPPQSKPQPTCHEVVLELHISKWQVQLMYHSRCHGHGCFQVCLLKSWYKVYMAMWPAGLCRFKTTPFSCMQNWKACMILKLLCGLQGTSVGQRVLQLSSGGYIIQ